MKKLTIEFENGLGRMSSVEFTPKRERAVKDGEFAGETNLWLRPGTYARLEKLGRFGNCQYGIARSFRFEGKTYNIKSDSRY